LRVLNRRQSRAHQHLHGGRAVGGVRLGPSSSLSFDGQTLAIAGRGEVRIRAPLGRRSDVADS
jgi:hypothetical protein